MTCRAAVRAPATTLVVQAARDFVAAEWAIQAAALRSLTQHLDMVAPDPVRCRHAFESGIYDECDSDEVIPFLENRPDHYDLIMAADLRPGEFELPLLFSAVKIALALAGVFIAVIPAGAFDAGELRDMAKAEGLIVLAVEPVMLPGGSGFCLVAES